jgi:O-antigen/teichoic acid export membrane protein
MTVHDPEPHLPQRHVDFRVRAIRGGALMFAAQAGKFLLYMAATILLARLLTPDDYGVFAVAFGVVTFISLFGDFGLSLATVQSPIITHQQMSTLFWLNLALGSTLAALALAIAPLIGRIYGDGRVAQVLAVTASIHVLVGLKSQHQALLTRRMQFMTLVAIDIASVAAGTMLAAAWAWYGTGYWALVVLHVATEITAAVGAWLSCPWRPGLPVRRSGVGPRVAFGGYLTGLNILGYLTNAFPNLLIGWYWGTRALGLYDKAYQLLLFPLNQFSRPLASVAHSTLSRLQHEPERYRTYLDKYILTSTGLGMPLVAFIFVVAETAVSVVLGPQWSGSVPIFRALAPAAFVMTFTASIGWIFISMGRLQRQLRWAAMTTFVTALAVALALPWGPVTVALAFSSWRVLSAVPTLVYCCRGSWLHWTDILTSAARPAAAACAAAVALAVVVPWVPSDEPMLALTMAGVLYGGLYIAFWMILPDGRRILFENLANVQLLWRQPDMVRVDG